MLSPWSCRKLKASRALLLLAALVLLVAAFVALRGPDRAQGGAPLQASLPTQGRVEQPSLEADPADRRGAPLTVHAAASAEPSDLPPQAPLHWIRLEDSVRGDPVMGAQVVFARPKYAELRTVSEADGLAQFDIDATRKAMSDIDGQEILDLWGLALRVDAAGYATSIVRLESGHSTRDSAQVVPLQRESALLLILTSAGGDPLVGADVRVSGKALETGGDLVSGAKRERIFSMRRDPLLGTMRAVGGSGAQDWHSTSDETGLAEVRGLPAEIPLTIVITGFGFVHQIEPASSILAPGEERVVEWRCPATGRVRGQLAAWEGLDLSRFHVALVAAGTRITPSAFLEENESLLAQSIARPDGSFEFENVPFGEYYCGLVPSRHPAGLAPAQRIVHTIAESVTSVTLALERGAAVDGIIAGVVDTRETIRLEFHRNGVPGAIQVPCDASTGFSFHAEPLPPGKYSIRGRGSMGSVVVPTEVTTGEFVTVSVER